MNMAFSPPFPFSPFLYLAFPLPFLAAAHIIAAAKHTRGENINQAGGGGGGGVSCGLWGASSIHLWQKWSNPINTDNPDMMDGVEKGEGGEGC